MPQIWNSGKGDFRGGPPDGGGRNRPGSGNHPSSERPQNMEMVSQGDTQVSNANQWYITSLTREDNLNIKINLSLNP